MPVDILKIDNSNILQLTEYQFYSNSLVDLKKVVLSSIGLVTIHDTSFRDMVKLEHLDLSKNKIRKLEKDVFLGLIELQFLDLSENKLLHFSGSSLVSSLKLNELDLHRNHLATFVVPDDLRQLNRLRIHDNPWICDCHLLPLRRLLTRLGEVARAKMCLEDRELRCPVSDSSITLEVVDAMSSPKLRCTVEAWPEVTPVWMLNGRTISILPHLVKEGGIPAIATSTIILPTDITGEFTCQAANYRKTKQVK